MKKTLAAAKDRNGSLASVKTIVDEFCRRLPSDECRIVRSTVEEIERLRRQITVNVLAIGDALQKLRSAIGSQEFHRFMRDVLPTFGLSRSTAYRWLSFIEKLPPLFPNPVVRHYLMAFTDGKGIVTSSKRQGLSDSSDLILTPAAEAALKRLPPVPPSRNNPAAAERWVRQFIKAIGTARSEARMKRRGPGETRAAIIQLFCGFARRYGLQAAEDLCGDLDKVLTQLVQETGEEMPATRTVPQLVPQLGSYSLPSPANDRPFTQSAPAIRG
jgi:hypothetical protein